LLIFGVLYLTSASTFPQPLRFNAFARLFAALTGITLTSLIVLRLASQDNLLVSGIDSMATFSHQICLNASLTQMAPELDVKDSSQAVR